MKVLILYIKIILSSFFKDQNDESAQTASIFSLLRVSWKSIEIFASEANSGRK